MKSLVGHRRYEHVISFARRKVFRPEMAIRFMLLAVTACFALIMASTLTEGLVLSIYGQSLRHGFGLGVGIAVFAAASWETRSLDLVGSLI